MSIGKYILIDPSECPSREDLMGGVERLYKCSELLSRLSGKNDPDPKGLKRVASFLEMLLKDNRLKQEILSDDEELLGTNKIEIAKAKIEKAEIKKSM